MSMDTPLRTIQSFICAQFEKRDIEGSLACLASGVVWLSAHIPETLRGKECVCLLLTNDIKNHPDEYFISYDDMAETMLTQDAASVSGHVFVTDKLSGMRVDCCLSATLVLNGGRYLIVSMHMSLPFSLQQEMDEAAAQRYRAECDSLTGLYNRETFIEKATGLIADREPGHFVLSCVDIDNFKLINDMYGAKKGDEVLKHIGRTMNRCFTAIGGICCRIMADIFAILYPRSFIDSEMISDITREASDPGGMLQPVTLSIGRYVVNDRSLPVSAMFDRARIASASVKGRFDVHIAHYDESMFERILREQAIVREMDSALYAGQFEIWLQPQYNHASSALIGAEALVRWRHPTRGIIAPGEFIPVFEQNGFIYEMDKYVWRLACSLLQRWQNSGARVVPISINISRCDIFHKSFFYDLTKLTEEFGIPADLLRLEITETAFAKSASHVISIVKRLISYGFTVEIDDFGSGYSSLNTLKDVPASVIKLDMNFLKSAENSQRGGNIIESVVRMAKWLGTAVIAEGVETREQANYLRSIGCRYVQGYLYGRPMPVSEFERLSASDDIESRITGLETVENLENNAFWDPASMDTLIFNSYVGGACIFEFYDGNVEVLRANDKYAAVVGGAGTSIEDAISMDWNRLFDAKNHRVAASSLRRAIETGREVACELVVNRAKDERRRAYISVASRVIARSGDHYLLYCMISDITAQREAERRILETSAQLRFLSEASAEMLAAEDVGGCIDGVLRKVKDHFCGSRVYVFELDHNGNVFNNTYELCSEGVTPEIANLQGISMDLLSFWLNSFEKHDYISIGNVDTLDDSRSEERRILEMQNIRSLIAAPMRNNSAVMGFIGVDDPSRNIKHTDRLAAIGNYMAVILARRDMAAKLENDNRALTDLMNDTPGAFAWLKAPHDGHPATPLYFNDAFPALFDMTKEEAMTIYGENAMNGVHPDDVETVLRFEREMLLSDGKCSARYRLRDKSGGYIWFLVLGRKTVNQAGEAFFNMYFSDLSKEAQKNLSLIEILTDDIPGGLAVYELSPEGTRTLYMSDSIHNSTGYTNEEYIDLFKERGGPLCLVFDEDKHIVREQAADMRRNGSPFNCTFRVHTKDGGFRWVSMRGSLAERIGDKSIVNAFFFDITEQKSVEERLRMSEERYRLALEHSGNIICSYDIAEKAVIMPPDTAAVFSMPTKVVDVPYAPVRMGNISKESVDNYVGFYESILRGDKSGSAIFRSITNCGWKWFKANFATIFSDDGAPISAVISLLDVTEAHEKELAYERYLQARRSDLRGRNTVYFDTDLTSNVVESYGGNIPNVMLFKSGISHDDMVSHCVNTYVNKEDIEQALALLNRETLIAGFYSGTSALSDVWRINLPDGMPRWMRADIQMIQDPYSGHIRAYTSLHDVTDEVVSSREIEKKAELDGLTGLFNRATTETLIRQRLEHGNGGCMLLLADLDNLKYINDTFGHPEGDRAIKLLASVFKAQFRRTDIIGRIGGDEFLIYLEGTASEAKQQSMLRILIEKLSALRIGECDDVCLHASIGVVIGESGRDSFESLYQRADKALYHVKRGGKNSFVFYSPDMK